jgi:hypothetical protein
MTMVKSIICLDMILSTVNYTLSIQYCHWSVEALELLFLLLACTAELFFYCNKNTESTVKQCMRLHMVDFYDTYRYYMNISCRHNG